MYFTQCAFKCGADHFNLHPYKLLSLGLHVHLAWGGDVFHGIEKLGLSHLEPVGTGRLNRLLLETSKCFFSSRFQM